MEKQIKCLKGKGNRFTVENPEDELAQFLIKKFLQSEGNGVITEWVYSYESPLVKPLLGKDFKQLVYGVCAKEVGVIHVFLDNILKVYQINGFEPIEQWFTVESTKNLVHELIHFLAPELSEQEVSKATEKFMEAWLSPEKATKLVIHIGNRTFEHLLTEDNRILEVKG